MGASFVFFDILCWGRSPYASIEGRAIKGTFGVCATAHSRTRAAYALRHIAARRKAYGIFIFDCIESENAIAAPSQYAATPRSVG